MRLLELQDETDSLQACAAAGRAAAEGSLRGWAALIPADALTVGEALREAGLVVLRGARAMLAAGGLPQLSSAARSVAERLEGEPQRALARLLADRAAHVESPARAPAWRLPRSTLARRTAIMGIVNATPDSFSDGGAYDPLQQALRLAEEGADILDLGGESTRPGAAAVSAAEERARTEPLVKELARRLPGLPLSIDTTKGDVARAALDAGAQIVNDVSALARDPQMAQAARGAALCLMHMRGTPADMRERALYTDLHGEVMDELQQALRRASAAGFPREAIALDPGLGFAKTAAHNLVLLRRLRELTQLGHPLLVGASRKAFIGAATGRPPAQRREGSVAAAVLAALNGAAVVRVHDVAATKDALAVVEAVRTSAA